MRAPTCEEYHVPVFVSANAVSAFLKRDGETWGSTRGIAPAIGSAQALCERVQLGGQLRRQVLEFRQVLAELGELRLPLLDVDAQQLGHRLVGDVHAARVDSVWAHGRDVADDGLLRGAVPG